MFLPRGVPPNPGFNMITISNPQLRIKLAGSNVCVAVRAVMLFDGEPAGGVLPLHRCRDYAWLRLLLYHALPPGAPQGPHRGGRTGWSVPANRKWSKSGHRKGSQFCSQLGKDALPKPKKLRGGCAAAGTATRRRAGLLGGAAAAAAEGGEDEPPFCALCQ